MKFEKVKSIAIRIATTNRDFVNKDGNDSPQKYGLHHSINADPNFSRDSNIIYGKHEFVPVTEPVGDKNLIALPKVSADCIRKEIFEDQIQPIAPAALPDDDRGRIFSCEAIIARGYLETEDSRSTTRRTTPFHFEDAICNDPIPPHITFEVRSKSGNKGSNLHAENSSGSNFFFEEMVGTWNSGSQGLFNLEEGQFFSLDDSYGRRALIDDDVSFIMAGFEERYGIKPTLGYFKTKTQIISFGEKGLLLPDEIMVAVVRYLLKRLLHLNILRKKASFVVNKVEIKFVTETSVLNLYSSEEGWITLDDQTVDSLDFSVNSKYIQVSNKDAENYNTVYASNAEAIKRKATDKKKDKEDQKAAAKIRRETPSKKQESSPAKRGRPSKK